MRIDDLTLAEAIMERRETGMPFQMVLEPYNDMYLIVSTSRRCDDGVEMNRTLLVASATVLDAELIFELYQGNSYGSPSPYPCPPSRLRGIQ
jgi:hypothetical protein